MDTTSKPLLVVLGDVLPLCPGTGLMPAYVWRAAALGYRSRRSLKGEEEPGSHGAAGSVCAASGRPPRPWGSMREGYTWPSDAFEEAA